MSVPKSNRTRKAIPESSTVELEDKLLEKALEECIVELEAGNDNLDSVLLRHPQFRRELEQFLDNWRQMQGAKAKLTAPVPFSVPLGEIYEGCSFGDFELLEQIGSGGMGVVFKAKQLSLNRIVALKMIVGPGHDRERFRMEAESAASLNHPNIVSIYEVGNDDDGRLFFSMQLIDGCDLKRYLELHRLENKQAAQIACSIALAVHYAHQRGILHRDLKPANILMDASGQPHITDFGLAKQIGRDTGLTHSGAIMGTPGYMAPEQASGRVKNLTTATDVYSIGAILFAMLTGRAPFTGESPLDVLRRVVEEDAPSPKTFREELDRDLETIGLKCLEKSPEQRYGSADLLADDLNRYLNGVPVLARPVSYPERFWRWCCRNPIVAGLTSLTLLMLIATVVSMTLLSISRNRTEALSHQVGGIQKSKQQALALVDKTRASLFVAQGKRNAEQSNVGEACLWFSHAARICCEDSDSYSLNMSRLKSWMVDHPQLLGSLWLPNNETEKTETVRVEFRPNANQLFCAKGPDFVLWDYHLDEKWVLNETLEDITCGTLFPDGQQVAIGRESGLVSILNLDARDVATEIEIFDAAISQIAVSSDGKQLAVVSGTQSVVWDFAKRQMLTVPADRGNHVTHVSFSNLSNRLIVVYSDKKCRVYDRDAGLDNRVNYVLDLEFPCFFEKPSEARQVFWPVLIKQESMIISKIDPQTIGVFDTDSGEQLGILESRKDIYCYAVNSEKLQTIACGFQNAELSQIEIPFSTKAFDRPAVADDNSRQGAQRPEFQLEHQGRVVSADFGPNQTFVTGSWDRCAKIWRKRKTTDPFQPTAEQMELVVTLPHQQRVVQTLFSGTRPVLATVQADGLIRVWALPESVSPSYEVETGPLGSMARVLNQDSWLTSGMSRLGANFTTLRFLPFEKDKQPSGFPNFDMSSLGALMDAAPCNDNRFLITAHANPLRGKASYGARDGTAGSLLMWDLKTGVPVFEPLQMPSEPRHIAINPKRNQIAVCTARMEVVLVDLSDFSVEATLVPTSEEGEVFVPRSLRPIHQFNQQLCYSPDGGRVIAWSNSADGIWVWDVDAAVLAYPKLETDGWPVNTVDVSEDGRSFVFSGGRGNVARIINLETGKSDVDDLIHPSAVYSARFSPDGSIVVTCCRDGRARVFDAATCALKASGLVHETDVVDAIFTPDMRLIVTLGIDNALRFWNVSDLSEALKPRRTPISARQILVSPDSRHVIVAGGRHVIPVFDIGQFQDQNTSPNDLEKAIALSELLAGKTVNEDGITENLSTSQWFDRWLEYSRR